MTMRMSIPVETQSRGRTAGEDVRRWLRLFAIEFRRSPALLAAVLIAAFSMWVMWISLPVGVVRWSEVSRSSGDAMILVSAIAAGISAYVAGQGDRLHLGDQLAQTSKGPVCRDLLAFLASLLWCVVGYLVPVAMIFGYAAMKATWGGPAWSYVYLTVATIIFGVSIGWFIGAVFRRQRTSLIAIGAVLLVHGTYPVFHTIRTAGFERPNGAMTFSANDAWYKNLFPYEMLDFHDLGSFTRLGALWLLAIALLLATVAWWWRHRSHLAIAGSVLSLVVGGIAGVGLAQKDPNDRTYRSATHVQRVCASRLNSQIEVCIHLQDKALLDEVADAIAQLVNPIVGLDGVPTRFTSQPATGLYQESDGVLFIVYDATGIPSTIYQTLLESMLVDRASVRGYHFGAAKYVVTLWLLQEAGVDDTSVNLRPISMVYSGEVGIREESTEPFDPSRRDHGINADELDAFERDVMDALNRFAALSSEEQRAWLEANWDALRAGELTLEDLP